MAKLTDKQHKKMIARYAECQNYSQVAREFNVSVSTVRRHVNGDEKTAKKVKQKKEQNTMEMLAFMDAKKGKAQDLIENIIEAMNNPEKLARANVKDLATALGIIIDKFTQNAPAAAQSNELLQSLMELERRSQHD